MCFVVDSKLTQVYRKKKTWIEAYKQMRWVTAGEQSTGCGPVTGWVGTGRIGKCGYSQYNMHRAANPSGVITNQDHGASKHQGGLYATVYKKFSPPWAALEKPDLPSPDCDISHLLRPISVAGYNVSFALTPANLKCTTRVWILPEDVLAVEAADGMSAFAIKARRLYVSPWCPLEDIKVWNLKSYKDVEIVI